MAAQRLFPALLLPLFLLSACGGTPGQPVDQPSAGTSSTPPPAIPPSESDPAGMSGSGMAGMDHAAAPYDQRFIDMMVPHHEGALDMAKIAGERAEHPELKAMAKSMLGAQEAEILKMKGWRKDWYGSADVPSMDMPMSHSEAGGMPMGHPELPGMASMMDMAKDIEALKTATPFDLAFIDAMIPHHQGAVDMAQDAAGKAQHAEIKDLSAAIVRDQQQEIGQFQEWRKKWYPTAPVASMR